MVGLTISAKSRFEVQELFARYAWAFDYGDAQAYANQFTPDGTVKPADGKIYQGRDAIRAFVQSHIDTPEWKGTQHHNNQFLFEEGDDTACTVRCYWSAIRWNRETNQKYIRVMGTYTNRCVKVEGRWYFKERHIRVWKNHELVWPSAAHDAALGRGISENVGNAPQTPALVKGKVAMTSDERWGVQDLFARYAWSFDLGDAKAYANQFTADGVLSTTDYKRHQGRDAIRTLVQTHIDHSEWKGTQHYNTHIVIDEGDSKSCIARCYFVAIRMHPTEDRNYFRVLGSYWNECVKIEDRWYFKERRIRYWKNQDLPWKGVPFAPAMANA